MTIPDHLLPKQTPGDRDFQELRERVHYLAVEVFHLTTELEELRRRMGTFGDAVPSDPQHAQPQEPAAPSPARVDVAASTENFEFDLDSFPPEGRHSAQQGDGVEEDRLGAEATAQDPIRPEPSRLASGRNAARFGGAIGLVTLLLVGFLRGGDGSDLVIEGGQAVTPSVSRASETPAPTSAAPVQRIPDVTAQPNQPGRGHSAPSPAPGETATDGGAASRLSVVRSAVGSDVLDREVVGQSATFVVGARVVFWTHIGGGRPGDTVRHVWSHNGREIGVTVLPVGSPSWRTQSRHTLVPESEGDWVVELQDGEGHTLASHRFRCEGPG